MAFGASASPRIVARGAGLPPAGPAYRALARAGWRRAAHAAAAMPAALRLEIVALGALAALLLAYHAGQSYYGAYLGDPQATAVTQLSRLIAAALVVCALALALLAPRLYARAGDLAFVRAVPLPPRAVAAWRADALAAAAVPFWAVGLGLLLPPLAFGHAGPVAGAGLALAAWLWAVAQGLALALTWSPEGRWGPGGVGGLLGRAARFLVVPAGGFAYFAARELTALLVDVRRAPSLLVTALIGALLGFAARRVVLAVADGSAAVEGRVAEHYEILAWKRRRAGRTRRWGVPLAWFAPGAAGVWAAKDLRIAARHRGLRAQWLLVLLLKGLALAWAFGARPEPPWAFAGLLLVLSDAVAGVALLQHWSLEQPGWVWAAPARRRAQWAARAVPALGLSLAGSLLLAAAAWTRSGGHVAQPLTLWTAVAGMSLVLAAANLGASTPPRSALGQNLYGLGLFAAFLVGAVFPVVGWAVLAVFALYTLRSLARDMRP